MDASGLQSGTSAPDDMTLKYATGFVASERVLMDGLNMST